MRISSVANTFQGEGPTAGERVVLLRLAGCNLRCVWCDTEYARDADSFPDLSVEEALRLVEERSWWSRRLLVTGGEPLLWKKEVEEMLKLSLANWTVEVETNGTIDPGEWLLRRVDLWNVSPKLSNSGHRWEERVNQTALSNLACRSRRAAFKFVVSSLSDADEIKQILSLLPCRPEVYVMPLGATRDELSRTTPIAEKVARMLGARVSPRLQVLHGWE